MRRLVPAARSLIGGPVIAFSAAAVAWFLSDTLGALGVSPATHVEEETVLTAAGVAGLVLGAVLLLLRPETVEPAARIAARAALVFVLTLYGVSKLLGAQFRLPFVALDTPLGDASGYALTWRFFGYAYGYEVFVAAGQIAGAGLLLAWRTTTLGACVLSVVLANIVAVNLTHNLPVKGFSAGLLALTVYLLAFDLPRLGAVFVANRPVGPRPFPSAGRGGWLTAGWAAVSVAHAVVFVTLLDSVPTPVSGAWAVVKADGPGTVGWERVYFERGFNGSNPGSVARAGGTRDRFVYDADPGGRLTILSPKVRFGGTYAVGPDGGLTLTGQLNGEPAEIRLTRRR